MEYETISDTEKSEHSTATHGPGERESLVAKIMRYTGLGLAALGALTLLAEGARRIDPVGRFFSFSLIISLSADSVCISPFGARTIETAARW
jgi:hypothetical protein